MQILYIGDSAPSSTSFHRALALKRLGHAVTVQDPFLACRGQLRNPVLNKLHFETGYRFLQGNVEKWLMDILAGPDKPDMVWVDSGELLGKKCLEIVKALHVPVVLYNVDDPTGNRDGNRFKSLLKALPFYDLVVAVRPETAQEYTKLGAARTLLVYRSYDEEAHEPYPTRNEVPSPFLSDIAFIGTWMRHEKRDEFLLTLIRKGLPVSIWGDRWHKSPYWNELKSHHRGGALGGRDYVAAIQGAKICLGMLSKGNRDQHTQRSLEIPYIGGLFCAERTVEHAALYIEDEEAVFWKDANECAEKCRALLADESTRERIRLAGMKRVRANKVGNEDICHAIIEELGSYQLV
ncbi:CgeB family protein [Larkinella harenae]